MIIKITGKKSTLNYHFEHHFQNDILKVGLISFSSTNLIQNITEKNNKLYYDNSVLTIPKGQYNFTTLKSFLENKGFNLKKKNNEIDIESNHKIIKEGEKSIFKLLSSSKKFIPVETINIHCNLADGMMIEGGKYHHKETDIICSFKMNSCFCHPIIYNPVHPIYFPIQHNNIYKIEVKICDENGELIDFNDANITIILEIK